MVPLELAEQLFDKVGPRYKLCFFRHLAAYEFALSLLRPQDRVLDLGCGTGYGTSVLAGRCAEIVGIDYCEDAIEYARKQYGSTGCSFTCADALNTGLPGGSVDVVCCVQVIEHMKDQEGFVSGVLRVLTSGGRFVVATPNKATYSPDADVGFAYHHKEYRAPELVEFLSKYFSSVKLYGLFARSVLARAYHDRDLRRYSRGSLLAFMPRFVRKKVRKLIWHRHKDSEISTNDFQVSSSGTGTRIPKSRQMTFR
jgi:ubiquinone/menaquinone biosynthesis C-methylase UbiE